MLFDGVVEEVLLWVGLSLFSLCYDSGLWGLVKARVSISHELHKCCFEDEIEKEKTNYLNAFGDIDQYAARWRDNFVQWFTQYKYH